MAVDVSDLEQVRGDALQVLLVADAGVAADQVDAALRARGYAVQRVAATEPDVFSRAVGQHAIVCLPSAGFLAPSGEASRAAVDAALSAGRAPGVRVLVFALPAAPAFDAAVEAIARNGKPFIVVRARALLEEIASAVQRGHGTLWLPRSGDVLVSRAEALAAQVADAVESERQGRSWPVPEERFDVAGLFATASDMAGAPVRVRPVPALLFRAVRPIARWLEGAEPPLLGLADQLLSQASSQHA